MNLTTERLALREFVLDDWKATHLYESNPDVVRYQTNDVRSPDESRRYIEGAIEKAREVPRQVYDLAVTLREGGELIGRCGMRLTQGTPGEAMLWFVSNPKTWGQGLITEACEALLDYAFLELRLHRVYGDCDPRNPASARVLEKLGMRQEAHLVENAFIKGEWCDSLIYAVLDREWKLNAPAGA